MTIESKKSPRISAGVAIEEMRAALNVESGEPTFDDIQYAAYWAMIYLAENKAGEFGHEMKRRRALAELDT